MKIPSTTCNLPHATDAALARWQQGGRTPSVPTSCTHLMLTRLINQNDVPPLTSSSLDKYCDVTFSSGDRIVPPAAAASWSSATPSLEPLATPIFCSCECHSSNVTEGDRLRRVGCIVLSMLCRMHNWNQIDMRITCARLNLCSDDKNSRMMHHGATVRRDMASHLLKSAACLTDHFKAKE